MTDPYIGQSDRPVFVAGFMTPKLEQIYGKYKVAKKLDPEALMPLELERKLQILCKDGSF